ncbi:MAG: hypothetical protein PUP92_19150 [Rhizonema sp. PD38]|nr:hypothetical protein [Rhizonema sp. PD38]
MIGRQKTYSVQLTEQEERRLQQQAMPAAGCAYARKTGQSTRQTCHNYTHDCRTPRLDGWEMSGQKRTTLYKISHAQTTIWEHFEAVIDNSLKNKTDQPPQNAKSAGGSFQGASFALRLSVFVK